MFRRQEEADTTRSDNRSRVDSVFGEGLSWKGSLSGAGGVRIDGAFDGDIAINGLLVIGSDGRVTCQKIKAVTIIISGSVKGDITAERVEIMPTGRVWGDIVTASFATQEGAFMRGQITMEESLDLGFSQPAAPAEADDDSESEQAEPDEED